MERGGTNGDFTRRVALLLGFVGVASLANGHFTARAQDVDVAKLTDLQLAAMLAQKDFFLVNVHIPYEGEIKDTDAFIAYDSIADNLDKLPQDKTAKIVVYCRSGRMSAIAARELVRLGFTHVSDLTGGMIDWENSGYKIIAK
jgi:rhodanese-related sulfurtransferase